MDSMNGPKGTYGDRLWLAHLDVNDKKAFADRGKIDVMVNNAGYGSSALSSR
jgi:NADP-dependent 3-hydroxy acid dehydrogenase YdfG